MELKEAIAAIFDGESLLFVGSGFSLGAKNACNGSSEMKGVTGLLRKMEEELGLSIGISNSMSRLSALYIKQRGAINLIDLLKREFQVSEISEDQKKICALDWFRIYTTNYDDVIERGFSFNAKPSTTVTVSDKYEDSVGKKDLIVHLNGYINTVTPDKLYNEFKLTEASYCTTEFNDSTWIQVFRNDLRVCKSVFFIGFSLEYDLDLARIIAMSSIKNKAFFVVSQDCSVVDKGALEDYGVVLPIGLSGFVNEIRTTQKTYKPKLPEIFEPISFTEPMLNRSFSKVRSEDFNELILTGQINSSLIQSSIQNVSTKYVINRSSLCHVLSKIESGDKNFMVESALGNGKTIFLYQLTCLLIEKGKKVFWYEHFTNKIYSEISAMSYLYPDAIIVLDDYHSAKEVLSAIRRMSKTIVVITSERQALHDAIYEDVQAVLGNYITISVDRMTAQECVEIERLFNAYSFWGDMTNLTPEARVSYIKNVCHSQLSSLILSRVKSSNIISKLNDAYSKFKFNTEFRRVFVVALIIEFYRLKVDVFDFASWVGADIINSPSFRNNIGIKEFLNTTNDSINVRSSIIAHHFLSEMDSNDVIDIMIDIVCRLDKTVKVSPEHKSAMIALMNFAQLSMCLEARRKGTLGPILRFYDEIKNLESCRDSIHFWLQYAIAQLTKEEYTIAKLYFDKCYALAKMTPGYQTYKIDNHYSRYLLENEIKNGTSEHCMEAFSEAHRILINTKVGDEKRYYPYRMALLYGDFYAKFYSSLNLEEQYDFLSKCNDMYQKCIVYIGNCDSQMGRDMAKKTERKLKSILSSNSYLGINSNFLFKKSRK